MKKTLIILTILPLALFSCGDKVEPKSDAAVKLAPKEILELEKENIEIESLETDLNQDLKQLDILLNELDNI